MKIRARHLISIWLFGFLLSLVIQSLFQGWFAAVTVWGRNVGWQTEIAIWNAGMSLVLIGLFRQSESVQAKVIPGLVILSLALGINHLLVAISKAGYFGNWLGASLNFGGVLLAVLYFLGQRR